MAHRVLKIESLMMFHCTKNVKAHVVAHVKAFFVANISFKKSNEGLCEYVSACVQVNLRNIPFYKVLRNSLSPHSNPVKMLRVWW